MENEEIEETFKDRLVKELYSRGMTYKSFAERVGISISSLNMYIYKGSMPAADVAVRMARVLGVSAEYLVLGIQFRTLAIQPGRSFRRFWTDFPSERRDV